MIKNIPNKYDQQMLIAEIDERHAGLYDFFYLPIDPKVTQPHSLTPRRTNAIKDLRSSTLCTLLLSSPSSTNSKTASGANLTAKKYVACAQLTLAADLQAFLRAHSGKRGPSAELPWDKRDAPPRKQHEISFN